MGSGHCLYLSPSGSVFASGMNNAGQLGLNHREALDDRAVRIPGIDNATQVSVGAAHSLILNRKGLVLSFGDSLHGQMGVENVRLSAVPTVVKNLPGRAVKIAAGGAHSVAMTVDGKVYVWGSNSQKQLGRELGLRASLPIPVKLSGNAHAVDIAAGPSYTAVLDSKGAVSLFGIETIDKRCCWPGARYLTSAQGSIHVSGEGAALLNVSSLPAAQETARHLNNATFAKTSRDGAFADAMSLPDGRWMAVTKMGQLHFDKPVCGFSASGRTLN